jgi:hypothetical protein
LENTVVGSSEFGEIAGDSSGKPGTLSYSSERELENWRRMAPKAASLLWLLMLFSCASAIDRSQFPPPSEFLFGTSTSAYQVPGRLSLIFQTISSSSSKLQSFLHIWPGIGQMLLVLPPNAPLQLGACRRSGRSGQGSEENRYYMRSCLTVQQHNNCISEEI